MKPGRERKRVQLVLPSAGWVQQQVDEALQMEVDVEPQTDVSAVGLSVSF